MAISHIDDLSSREALISAIALTAEENGDKSLKGLAKFAAKSNSNVPDDLLVKVFKTKIVGSAQTENNSLLQKP
jgi:hypothetical protein